MSNATRRADREREALRPNPRDQPVPDTSKAPAPGFSDRSARPTDTSTAAVQSFGGRAGASAAGAGMGAVGVRRFPRGEGPPAGAGPGRETVGSMSPDAGGPRPEEETAAGAGVQRLPAEERAPAGEAGAGPAPEEDVADAGGGHDLYRVPEEDRGRAFADGADAEAYRLPEDAAASAEGAEQTHGVYRIPEDRQVFADGADAEAYRLPEEERAPVGGAEVQRAPEAEEERAPVGGGRRADVGPVGVRGVREDERPGGRRYGRR